MRPNGPGGCAISIRSMLIYPNLIVQRHHGLTVRTFMPASATAITVTAWEAAARDELPEVRQRRLDSR